MIDIWGQFTFLSQITNRYRLSRNHRFPISSAPGRRYALETGWEHFAGKLACGNYASTRHLGSEGGRENLDSDPLGPKTPRRGWVGAEKLSGNLSCCSQRRIEKGMIANRGLKASC